MENQNNLHLNEQAVDALRESAKWSMFLSILGFVGIGFMVILAVFMGFAMSMIPNSSDLGPFGAMKGFLSLMYLILAAIYFFPILYLYRYSSQMKRGLQMADSETVSNALVNLKSHHKFLGITAIVMISLYIIIIIGAIVAGVAAASSGF